VYYYSFYPYLHYTVIIPQSHAFLISKDQRTSQEKEKEKKKKKKDPKNPSTVQKRRKEET